MSAMASMKMSVPQVMPYFTGAKVDNSSLSTSLVVVNSVFLSVVLITTGLRFWVRYGMIRAGGLDDLLMIFALLFAVLLSTAALVGESYGLGEHIWNLSPGNTANVASTAATINKSLFGSYLAYSTAITFTKFSIIATYFRIFGPGGLRKIILGVGILELLFWISSIFAIIFSCVPVRAAWDYNVQGRCYPIVDFFYASSAFNIVTDIVLCAIPIPTLWALSMPRPQRLILCALFGGGIFACVASILRLTHLDHLSDGVDVSYETVSALNWSIIEVDTGIICAAISALRPLGRWFMPTYFPYAMSSAWKSSVGLRSPTPAPTPDPIQIPPGFSKAALKTLKAFASPQSPTMPPMTPTSYNRSNSISSAKSDIYVQKSFQIKHLPPVPPMPQQPLAIATVLSEKRGSWAGGENLADRRSMSIKRLTITDKHSSLGMTSILGEKSSMERHSLDKKAPASQEDSKNISSEAEHTVQLSTRSDSVPIGLGLKEGAMTQRQSNTGTMTTDDLLQHYDRSSSSYTGLDSPVLRDDQRAVAQNEETQHLEEMDYVDQNPIHETSDTNERPNTMTERNSRRRGVVGMFTADFFDQQTSDSENERVPELDYDSSGDETETY